MKITFLIFILVVPSKYLKKLIKLILKLVSED